MDKETHSVIEGHVSGILKALKLNVKSEGLQNTPKRVAESLKFLTKGYSQNASEILTKGIFTEKYNQMVLVKDVDFFSLCEHHLLPFFGKCHVGYIPNGKVIGLSKIPRIIEVYARRLQVQERLTQEIANAIQTAIKPRGVGVVIEAFHLCMAMRGVEKQSTYATTSEMLGIFESHGRTRIEFLNFIHRAVTR